MQYSIAYWILFFVRYYLFFLIQGKYGWKAAFIALAYATATDLSDKV